MVLIILFPPAQSCTKVAVDFVSPENVHECLRLTEEFRQLPINHKAREDKLEVMGLFYGNMPPSPLFFPITILVIVHSCVDLHKNLLSLFHLVYLGL